MSIYKYWRWYSRGHVNSQKTIFNAITNFHVAWKSLFTRRKEAEVISRRFPVYFRSVLIYTDTIDPNTIHAHRRSSRVPTVYSHMWQNVGNVSGEFWINGSDRNVACPNGCYWLDEQFSRGFADNNDARQRISYTNRFASLLFFFSTLVYLWQNVLLSDTTCAPIVKPRTGIRPYLFTDGSVRAPRRERHGPRVWIEINCDHDIRVARDGCYSCLFWTMCPLCVFFLMNP